VTTQFTRKAGDLRHVFLTVTQDYEFPIRTRAMRPARESCETCHFPEKFSDDSLREITHYEGDSTVPQSTFLVMKTGGGTEREGLGRGIHWHIENEVYFLANDDLEQEIPYVRVVDEDGSITEYYDIEADFGPEDVAGSTLKKMDCITCHNRVTHTIPKPEEAIDEALRKGLLSQELPEIRERSVDVLSQDHGTDEAAYEAIEGLQDFYIENYPNVALENFDEINNAVDLVRDLYGQMVFREQKIDWTTHPDNLGHKEDPGCFRCHDGKHLSGEEEAIRLECNLCHSIPVVSDNRGLVTNLELVRGPEPPSHTHTSWMTLHGKTLDSSCAACHIPGDDSIDYTTLEDKPPIDGSFCGNSACHGAEWQHTGFDSPMLEPVLARQSYLLMNTSPYLLEGVPHTYEGMFAALFNGRCIDCHSGPNAEADLDLSSYEAILQGNENGAGIIPGDAAGSLIVQAQSGSRDHFGQMLADELEAVEAWIAAGAPES
jgi:hypothetical protein